MIKNTLKEELLERYDNLSLYDYKKLRKEEKSKVSKPKALKNKFRDEARDIVWNYLLDNKNPDKYNAHQTFFTHSYQNKPDPDDLDSNQGAINLLESQRRFFQMKDTLDTSSKVLHHMDLNSAYIFALSNIKHSLKYSFKHKIEHLNDYVYSDKFFHIIKIRCTIPYDHRLNMFIPNTKMRFKGKPVGNTNQPNYGDKVEATLELFINIKYKINALDTWNSIVEYMDIDYKSITVWCYDLVPRNEIFNTDDVKELLSILDLNNPNMNPLEKLDWKLALTSFTGMLQHIDPGRRLLMLITCEEIMRQIYTKISLYSRVYSITIDGILYEPWNELEFIPARELGHNIIRNIYNRKWSQDVPEDFLKIEVIKPNRIKETAFRLQITKEGKKKWLKYPRKD